MTRTASTRMARVPSVLKKGTCGMTQRRIEDGQRNVVARLSTSEAAFKDRLAMVALSRIMIASMVAATRLGR